MPNLPVCVRVGGSRHMEGVAEQTTRPLLPNPGQNVLGTLPAVPPIGGDCRRGAGSEHRPWGGHKNRESKPRAARGIRKTPLGNHPPALFLRSFLVHNKKAAACDSDFLNVTRGRDRICRRYRPCSSSGREVVSPLIARASARASESV